MIEDIPEIEPLTTVIRIKCNEITKEMFKQFFPKD